VTLDPAGSASVRRVHEGGLFALGFADVRIVLGGRDTGEAFAMSQQSLNPRALAGPLHRHTKEAGFIYVIDGTIGARLDSEVVRADPGDTVFVQRGMSHTFWNETNAQAEVLEIFTPAGLEDWFHELAEIVASDSFDLDTIVESARRFGTELDLGSIQDLIEAHDLTFAAPS
jgi:quercetin dioxygenase-like cupin family protein